MPWTERIEALLAEHGGVHANLPRREWIRRALERREAFASACGALATWTPPESTGRSPKDTVVVRRPGSEEHIDWDSPNNLPITPETFDRLMHETLAVLAAKQELFLTDRTVGADPAWMMPVRTLSSHALTALFTDNLFRPVPAELERSLFRERPFTLLVAPWDKLDRTRFEGRLRVNPATGKTSDMVVAFDLDRRLGIVHGSAYGGSVKKLVFTVMSYYLPQAGILPVHGSANEGPAGDTALLLGLSGTGKTTLSADPRRALIGDDEHGWGPEGIANLEGGCYAKLIDLDPTREPEIYQAVFHQADPLAHGAIVENALFYPDGRFDLGDRRLAENSRASYPLRFLKNIKADPLGGHPRTILFLTADAGGVLPPVARLDRDQAMLWFLMGYTSKMAGTETGVVEPVITFSRFFGQPFMPCHPRVYTGLLGKLLDRHGTKVYLVNTGWTGGPYGVGARMDIARTRAMVQAALSGALEEVPFDPDPIFKIGVPRSCPGLSDASILNPVNTWRDRAAFEAGARKLAGEFARHFEKAFAGSGLDPSLAAQCPGL